jgi:hypothetical protein
VKNVYASPRRRPSRSFVAVRHGMIGPTNLFNRLDATTKQVAGAAW